MPSQAGYTSHVLQCQEKNIHGTITGQRQESPVLFFARLWAQAPEEIIRKVSWVPVELWAFAHRVEAYEDSFPVYPSTAPKPFSVPQNGN